MSFKTPNIERLIQTIKSSFQIPNVDNLTKWPKNELLSQLLKEREEFYSSQQTIVLDKINDHVKSQSNGLTYIEVATNWFDYSSKYLTYISQGHTVSMCKNEQFQAIDNPFYVKFKSLCHPGFSHEHFLRCKPSEVERLSIFLCGWTLTIDETDRYVRWGN